MDVTTVYETVNSRYSSIATSATLDEEIISQNSRIASSFGYSEEELAKLPTGANLGLSCGNPLAVAHLKPSEVMVDLGSGGGLDCLIAANQMIQAEPMPTGKVYGIDRSEAMIALASKNVAKANLPGELVELVRAPISDIPLPASTADLVVSNCVINLVPDEDKPQVFREIHRILKPGGRVAISDLLAKKPLPDHIRRDAALLVGCVAGASLVDDYRRWIEEAGFQEDSIVFVDTKKDLNVYHEAGSLAVCCGTDSEGGEGSTCCSTAAIPRTDDKTCGDETGDAESCCIVDQAARCKVNFNVWVASYQIYAIK